MATTIAYSFFYSITPVKAFFFAFTLTLILFLNLNLFSQTITVKQDGTGDYILIQDALNTSSNGDTVLVYPGTYYENLNIENKYITLGSLFLTTGNNEYIYQTIINGNQTGTCIRVYECASEVSINGFSFINGSGNTWGANTTAGGGVFVYESVLSIYSCIISNNSATGQGGGVWAKNSQLFLSATTIKYNNANWLGGGICSIITPLTFDTTLLCNIYCNTGSEGTDIYNGSLYPYVFNHIVVDTFTVIEPDYYYLYSNALDTVHPGYTLSWEINNGKLEQTSQNIYVSNTGSNSNSGLTPGEPLKNIWFALLKMKSDSISPDTILLEDGIYSQSSGEKFPLSLKRDVSIKGSSIENSIIDAEDKTYHFQGIKFANNYTIGDLTLRNGNGDKNTGFGAGSFIMEKNFNASFSNVKLTGNSGFQGSCGLVTNSNNFSFENTRFIDNLGAKALRFMHGESYFDYYDTNYVTNCIFKYNDADTNYGYVGGGLTLLGKVSSPETFHFVVTNSLFTENYCRPIHSAPQSTAIAIIEGVNLHLINSTIVDNESINPEAAALGIVYGSSLNIINSIIYNNNYASAYMFTDSYSGENSLSVQHSLFDGGEEGIIILTSLNNLNYHESNIDTDPLFYGGPDFPYNLSNNSPCIDAGTLDIPDWIELPEYDLAGNPRIYGATIDMGAYEWNPTVGVDESINQVKNKLLSLAPNPASNQTIISVMSSGAENMKIEVFNNNGQRVAVIIDGPVASGTLHTSWDLTSKGSRLIPGIYYIVLSEDGFEKENTKLVIK